LRRLVLPDQLEVDSRTARRSDQSSDEELNRFLIAISIMTTPLVVIVSPILVMPIGIPMPAVVVFPVPVTLMIFPSPRIVVIVRVGPICSWVRGTLVMACNPLITAPLRSPISFHPNELRFRRRWGRWLYTNRWRRNADED
jgi:hypothetical protein